MLVGISTILCVLQGFHSSSAQSSPSQILGDCGEVIYRSNEKSPNQIFIIGISHRDTLTRANGDNTAKVQTEIYKIGDWLIHRHGLELLLPEGFFSNKSAKVEEEKVSADQRRGRCTGLFDLKDIEDKLANDKTFVNAEMLLKENHSVRLRQVEDDKSYWAVRDGVMKLVGNGKNSCDFASAKSELDYLQEKRTAAMLQRIPGIVDDEFQRGNIQARKAIFTIGISHLNKIIQYLREHRIKISPPPGSPDKSAGYVDQLKLQKEDFGISIIIPKTLADDQKILTMNGLDNIVVQSRSQVSVVRSTLQPSP